MSSIIPSAPAYGVYLNSLIMHVVAQTISRHKALVTRLLSQGYKVKIVCPSHLKFYGRLTDLVGQYKENIC